MFDTVVVAVFFSGEIKGALSDFPTHWSFKGVSKSKGASNEGFGASRGSVVSRNLTRELALWMLVKGFGSSVLLHLLKSVTTCLYRIGTLTPLCTWVHLPSGRQCTRCAHHPAPRKTPGRARPATFPGLCGVVEPLYTAPVLQ